MVDGGPAAGSQAPVSGFEPGADGEAVLVGQGEGQLEDVLAPAIGQAVPVEVGGGEPGADDTLDLPAELGLDLVDPGLCEQVGDLARFVQGSGRVQ